MDGWKRLQRVRRILEFETCKRFVYLRTRAEAPGHRRHRKLFASRWSRYQLVSRSARISPGYDQACDDRAGARGSHLDLSGELSRGGRHNGKVLRQAQATEI